MSKVISFSQFQRAQHLSFLEQKKREYQEREDYLGRLRRLLFQIEAQMRQAEILQLELFLQVARHFQLPVELPVHGDRFSLQRAFVENPLLFALAEYFAGRLGAEECLERIARLAGWSPPEPAEA